MLVILRPGRRSPALGVRRHLVEGRDALTRGKDELIDGNAATARGEFESAHQEFEAAADGSRSIWLSIVDAIPFVGNTPDAIRAVADAGVQTSDAAAGLAGAVEDLPGGLGALAPTAEGIPIDRLAGAHRRDQPRRRADRGRRSTRWSRPRPDSSSPPWRPPGPTRSPSSPTLHRQLHAGSLILDGLPSFLGADGPRHYFFGASNPAELRGTGGLIGAYAILTIDGGRLSFSDFRRSSRSRAPT